MFLFFVLYHLTLSVNFHGSGLWHITHSSSTLSFQGHVISSTSPSQQNLPEKQLLCYAKLKVRCNFIIQIHKFTVKIDTISINLLFECVKIVEFNLNSHMFLVMYQDIRFLNQDVNEDARNVPPLLHPHYLSAPVRIQSINPFSLSFWFQFDSIWRWFLLRKLLDKCWDVECAIYNLTGKCLGRQKYRNHFNLHSIRPLPAYPIELFGNGTQSNTNRSIGFGIRT